LHSHLSILERLGFKIVLQFHPFYLDIANHRTSKASPVNLWNQSFWTIDKLRWCCGRNFIILLLNADDKLSENLERNRWSNTVWRRALGQWRFPSCSGRINATETMSLSESTGYHPYLDYPQPTLSEVPEFKLIFPFWFQRDCACHRRNQISRIAAQGRLFPRVTNRRNRKWQKKLPSK
jgi:hypothetical protein